MMRRLVKRHNGILPLDTAESIWRVIIATFTYVQAPFSVHADLSAGDAADARFRPLPFRLYRAVRARIWARPAWSRRSPNPRAISAWCRPSRCAGAGAWWSALEFDAAPKIIARLPFVERADHPAALPVFVLSRVAARRHGDGSRGLERARRRLERRRAAEALSMLAEFIAVPDRAFDGAALLVSLPQDVALDRISEALVKAGATVRSSALVGSHATRYTVAAERA